MLTGARRRYLDILASIYIYNEYIGYSSIDRLLHGLKSNHPTPTHFIAAIEMHRRDERMHYLMFRRYFEAQRSKPYVVDNTCAHIDRLIRLTFGCSIRDLDVDTMVADGDLLERMCRVVMLTEMRGMRQVKMLLRGRLLASDTSLLKIFRVIERDEPSHWAPYQRWIEHHSGKMPTVGERIADAWVHATLLGFKLPILYLNPWLPRRAAWHDEQARASQT